MENSSSPSSSSPSNNPDVVEASASAHDNEEQTPREIVGEKNENYPDNSNDDTVKTEEAGYEDSDEASNNEEKIVDNDENGSDDNNNDEQQGRPDKDGLAASTSSSTGPSSSGGGGEVEESKKQEEGNNDDKDECVNEDTHKSEGEIVGTVMPGAIACTGPPPLVKGNATTMDADTNNRQQGQNVRTESLLDDTEEATSGYIQQHASVMKPMEEGRSSRARSEQKPGAVSVQPGSRPGQLQDLEGNLKTDDTATSMGQSNEPSSPKSQHQGLGELESDIESKVAVSEETSSPKPQRQELQAFESEITSKLRTSPTTTSVPPPSASLRSELESFSNEVAAKSGISTTSSTLRSASSSSMVSDTYNYSPRRRINPGVVHMPPDERELMMAAAAAAENNSETDERGNASNNADSSNHNSDTGNDVEQPQRHQPSQTLLRDSKLLSQGTIVALPLESWNVMEEQERVKELERRAQSLQYERDNAPRAEVVGSTTEMGLPSTQFDTSGGSEHGESSSDNKRTFLWKLLLVAVLMLIIVIVVVAVGLAKSSSTDRPLDSRGEDDGLAPTMSPTSISPNNLPPTLQRIYDRGYVICRGSPDEVQTGVGFSVDMCSAIAAAVLDDPDKFEMPYITFRDQFDAIVNGTVDVSTAQTTPTMERDILEPLSKYGMTFTIPYFYSGTTFAGVPEFVDCADQGETLKGDCRDLSVCVVDGSVTQDLVRDILGGTVMHTVTTREEFFLRLADGTCNVITGAPMLIYEEAAVEAGYTGPYVFAPRFYNRDPLALTTRNDDPEFGDMVNWLLRALIVAEAMNITQDRADQFPTTDLFGEKYTHLFQNAIAAVGNFGELYSRTWGDRVPRQPGGINSPHLTSDQGGLLYPNPLGNIDDLDSALGAEELTHLGPIPNGTLEEIAERQGLLCGIIVNETRQPGLAEWNSTSGNWEGLDIEYCRGITAAVLAGDVSKLMLVPFHSLENGFSALASRNVDVLAGAVYNITNDVREPTTGQGFEFSDIYYYHVEEEGDDGEEVVPLALATREGDFQWSDFVRSTVAATIYAEAEGITMDTAIEMPLYELFGPAYRQALRDVIVSIGNYAELYERNVEMYLPRANNKRNTLNTGGNPMFFANWRFD